ncbi:MAG: hypothetical protein CMI01_05485 [Oceanospirillaceae bacterium]|nr:hypothetical protein [Oceanospirillaceae bacterium]
MPLIQSNTLLSLLLALFLAGCAAQAPEIRAPESSVKPRALSTQPMSGMGQEQQLALALISHYLGGPLYRMSNPLPMSRQYRLGEAVYSPDRRQMIVLMQHQNQPTWAMVTFSVPAGAIMNAFDVQRNGQDAYALVLKNARFCLVTGAGQPPVWGGSGWAFDKQQPGRFECSGQTRGSLYQSYSGMPGLLGVYAEDGDTVLFAERWSELQQIASGLKTLFPHLQVPRLP